MNAKDLLILKQLTDACAALCLAYDQAQESQSIDWNQVDYAYSLADSALKKAGIR